MLPQSIKKGVVAHIIRFDLLRRQEFRESILSTTHALEFKKRAGHRARILWDMIVAQSEAYLSEKTMATSDIHLLTGISRTTAGRCIQILAELGIFLLSTDPKDRRRTLIELSESSRKILDNYVHECFVEFKDLILSHHDRERLKTEAALEKSEERFRILFENANIAINIKDSQGRYVLTNSNYKSRFATDGRVEEDGKTVFDLHDPDYAAFVLETDQAVLRNGEPTQIEAPIRLADGSMALCLINKFPMPSPSGDDMWVGSAVVDVTDLRETQERLIQREAQLRAVFDSVSDAISVKDLDQRFILVNRALCERIGRSEEDILGKTNAEVFSSDEVREIDDSDRAALRGETVHTEYTIVTKKSKILVDVLKSPIFDAARKVIGMCGVSRDVTERKKLELAIEESKARLQALLDNSPWTITVKDIEGRYLMVNRAHAQYFSAQPEEFIGKNAYDFYSLEDADTITTQEREVVRSEKPQIFEGTRQFSKTGQRRLMSVRFPIFDHDSRIVSIGGIAIDVTEQREMEDMVRESYKLRSVGQLTGGVAHEFNNILQVVETNLELVKATIPEGSEAEKLLNNALRAGHRGARLTNHLLAFSRQQTLHSERIDARSTIIGMKTLLSRTLGKDVSIRTKFSDGVANVVVDVNCLTNALLNLALNARAAMPKGGTLTVAVGKRRFEKAILIDNEPLPSGDYVEIAVTDTGCGMSEETLARAFEPFFTTQDVGKGSGLGLSMVYGFARQSGGNVTIESDLGKGTTVRIVLPAAANDAVPTNVAETTGEAKRHSTVSDLNSRP